MCNYGYTGKNIMVTVDCREGKLGVIDKITVSRSVTDGVQVQP